MDGLNLADYRALSFDCYGTMIDWEAGIAAVLRPWAREVGLDLDDEQLLAAYGDNEAAVEQALPTARYPEVLAMAFRRTGEALGRAVDDAWAGRLGGSVPDWPAFPDSAGALASLATHYQLIVVSNVHRDGFAASNRRLRGRFAAIITAEDVHAYKPADNHFRALLHTLDGLGIARGEPSEDSGVATIDVDDIKAEAERLRAAGHEVGVVLELHGQMRLLDVFDPDGNRIQLAQVLDETT